MLESLECPGYKDSLGGLEFHLYQIKTYSKFKKEKEEKKEPVDRRSIIWIITLTGNLV